MPRRGSIADTAGVEGRLEGIGPEDVAVAEQTGLQPMEVEEQRATSSTILAPVDGGWGAWGYLAGATGLEVSIRNLVQSRHC
jgi:hypothetical protein